MTEHNLEDKIKLLRQIKPDNEWKESNRVFLLSECRRTDAEQYAEQTQKNVNGFSGLWQMGRLFRFRPAMAAVLVVIFTITGCAYGLNISQKSLPGDMLWNVKVSLENARTTFSSGEKKIKLETEFAGKRLEELKAVSVEEKPKAVAQAVENFKVHINEAKEGLKELELSEEKLSFDGTEAKLQQTYAAITAVEAVEAEYKAWVEERTTEIKGRIESAKEILRSAQNDSVELEEEIDKAEALLGEGELVEALEKILEIEKIIEVK